MFVVNNSLYCLCTLPKDLNVEASNNDNFVISSVSKHVFRRLILCIYKPVADVLKQMKCILNVY